MVSIAGLEKKDVLQALYCRAKPQGKRSSAYPILVSEEECKKTFLCENCLTTAPGIPWPEGWWKTGRSRLRIPVDSGCYIAEHCPTCCQRAHNISSWAEFILDFESNPTQDEIDNLRDGLKS
jgi:hypothetical protein